MLTILPAFDDNYIWLFGLPGRRIVVDPGDARVVIDALNDEVPAAILITHHHGDHIGGLPELCARWPDVPVYAPEDPRIPLATRRVQNGDVVTAGDMSFEVIAVPGHTLSHVAYVGEGHLFCGDTLFSLGCGRLFEGTPQQMLNSLQRLSQLPASTKVCCAHEYTAGNAAFALTVDPDNADLKAYAVQIAELRAAGHPTLPSTLALEKACNPFLRSDTPAIIDRVSSHSGQILSNPAAQFAALRAWKDVYR